jgi:hypothetical protein
MFLGSSAINTCEPVESVTTENREHIEPSDDEEPLRVDETSDDEPPTAKRQRTVVEANSDSDGREPNTEKGPSPKKVKRSATIRRRPQSIIETIREELVASRTASNEISSVIRESLAALSPLIRSLAAAIPVSDTQPQQTQQQIYQAYSIPQFLPYMSNTVYQPFQNGSTSQSNWSDIGSSENSPSFTNLE